MLHTAPVDRALALPLSSFFPQCLPLSPSISPKPMIATTSNRDCDEGRARLSRRKERRRAGREEGSEGGRRRRGEAGRGGGAILPFPFGDKRSFMPPATEPLLRRGGGYTERSTSEHERRREADERTDCRLRPMPPTTALATRRKRYMRAQKALSRLSSMVAACLGRRNECKRATYRHCSRFVAAAL